MLWTRDCAVPLGSSYLNTGRQVTRLALTDTEGLGMKTSSSGLGKAALHPSSQSCLLLFGFFSSPNCPEHSFEEDFLLIKSFTMWANASFVLSPWFCKGSLGGQTNFLCFIPKFFWPSKEVITIKIQCSGSKIMKFSSVERYFPLSQVIPKGPWKKLWTCLSIPLGEGWNQGSFDANSKGVLSDWDRKLQTVWVCAFCTKIILWWISDTPHIYYKSTRECKYSDSTLSRLQYARIQMLSRHFYLALWQITQQVVDALSTHPTPPILPSDRNPSNPSLFPL